MTHHIKILAIYSFHSMNSNHQLLIKDIQIISNISLPYSQSIPTNHKKNTKDRATRTSLKSAIQVNSGSSEGEAVPVPLVAPVVS
jgi:hypothetical protein